MKSLHYSQGRSLEGLCFGKNFESIYIAIVNATARTAIFKIKMFQTEIISKSLQRYKPVTFEGSPGATAQEAEFQK
jgi:hypothetical protein